MVDQITLASYPLTTSLFSERQPQIPDLFLQIIIIKIKFLYIN